MKKLYTLILTLFCVLSASALPAELYLYGNFNNWTTPDQDKDLFILSPTGTAGTYSGTFDIPAQDQYSGLQFNVITSKTNNKDDSYGTIDYSTRNMYVFSDLNYETKLFKGLGRFSSPCVVNWKGGKITFICTLDESAGEMNITLIAPDQPATPPSPENVWIIGDFNDWAVPSASSDNGAIKLSKQDNFLKSPYYAASNAAIPSGKAKFIYYYIDPADNKAKFVEGCEYTQAMSIYRCKESQPSGGTFVHWGINSTYVHENLSDARERATNILNYTGPDLSFELFWNLGKTVPESGYIYWKDAPVNDVNNLYLYIENIDTGEKTLVAPDKEDEWNIIWTKNLKGNVKIWLTESTSLPVDNKWGVYSDTGIEFEFGWGFARSYCIPDGKPITLNMGNFNGSIDAFFDKDVHMIQITSNPMGPYNAEKLYVIGYLSDWEEPIEANASKFQTLEKVSKGVFEGIVNFPSTSGMSFTDPQFRLHYKLEGWSRFGSIGASSNEQIPVNIEFADSQYSSSIITDAKGNWRLPEWITDGDVKIHVDLNTNTMTLTNFSTNSVEGIESEEMNAPIVYFNLQGQRVINPSNGIFIRVQGAKSEKVILK